MRLVSRKPAEAAPARMGALAKLPVFLDLAGKRAVVAGGSAPAAWKAELLAAAGARVEVYAAELAAEMQALLDRGAASGTLQHYPREWSSDILAGAAVALADVESSEDARAFHSAAQAAGVPVNVIDKPAYCQFQFGSIVNRSPVVVGISTDGGAPILGQAIRRRIETLLPPSIAAWGRLAKEVRAAVGARIAPGTARRLFWERFAERAFGAAPAVGDLGWLAGLVEEIARKDDAGRGCVTLVGAGPGDAELLTLKAVRALQAADVILYDDLVSNEVLELARREAKRMMVGKRGARESCEQSDINALMVKLALQGKQVVRLKSGDPMIFGRAGEEIEQLEREGIAVAIVPGITSASAMAAALGISLTHRDCAHSVRFVTGHARSGKLPAELDWRGLADPQTTLVVYMGGRTAAGLARRLISEGFGPQTAVVAVASLSRPEEKRWAATLDELAQSGLPPWLENPVLVGIGRVFADRVEAKPTAIGIDQCSPPPAVCATGQS
jgi:uroporphyrin-III C-methyltransferase/precorrin-2 dehydrogenase/sirohydrochlorin ferrochelatase